MSNYKIDDIRIALSKLGLVNGDTIFIHSNLFHFGILSNVTISIDEYSRVFYEELINLIGRNGTLIVPTFSYSFMKNEVYNPENSVSSMGVFSEYIRQEPNSIRSLDPNFSIACIGLNCEYYIRQDTNHSFGINSFFHKFYINNGKFINMNLDAGTTFIHFIEKQEKVHYRFDKKFCGHLIIGDNLKQDCYYHFVYDLNNNYNEPDFSRVEDLLIGKDSIKKVNLGLGRLLSFAAKDYYEVISNELKINKNFLIKGGL
jgi:aminoglycoside 3-N-acetyltransferase